MRAARGTVGGEDARTRGAKTARERLARAASTGKSACVCATRAGVAGVQALTSPNKVPAKVRLHICDEIEAEPTTFQGFVSETRLIT